MSFGLRRAKVLG